jgi:hypothetical protein
MKKTNLETKRETLKKQVELLQKPSGTITVAGDLDTIERKFYNKLLQNANMQLRNNINEVNFGITLKELKNALDISENDKHNNYYKKLLRKLYETSVIYNILEKDKTINGMAHLIDNLDFKINNETKEVTVFYTIPLIIKKSLVSIINGDPEALYAKINLAIIKGLKSKYSIILYELYRDYQNVEIPEMSINQFKKLLGIENKKAYNDSSNGIGNIKRRILNVAMNELNKNPNIEFVVTYKLIKSANVYTHIKFIIKTKTEQKIVEEKRDNMHLKILFDALPEQERTKNIERYLSQCLKSYDAKYLLHQIEYVTKQKPKNFFAYLKKAIMEDYANNELAEEQAKVEREKIESAIRRRLEELEQEKNETVERLISIEKSKIYEEYVNLLENNEKEELFRKYKEKVKELYPDLSESSFEFEYKLERLITEDIVKHETYQNRLEKARKKAEERAELEYKMEKDKLNYEIENGLL